MAVKHPKIAGKDAIFRGKESYWTWDSHNPSSKVVPDLNLITANSVGENFSMLKRNMITKSDVSKKIR